MNNRLTQASAAIILMACMSFGSPLLAQSGSADASSAPVTATIIAREVTVVDGDTLAAISARELGKAGYAAQLAEFNQLVVDAPLTPGDIIRIPILVAGEAESAQVVFVKGTVIITRPGAAAASTADTGDDAADATVFDLERDFDVYPGDTILTSSDGYVSIEFSSGSVINLQPDTEATLSLLACLPENDDCIIEITTYKGKITSDVNKRDEQDVDFRISTPYASAAVRGTMFDVEASEVLRVGVTEGSVDLNAQQQSVDLESGFGSVVEEGQPPAAPVPLLPAPVFKRVPTRMAPGDNVAWWPFTDADAYIARLANDEAGVETLASYDTLIDQLEVTGVEAGDYYLLLRAVDGNGLRGFTSNTRLTIADIDNSIAPVNTLITRQGQEFLVEVQNPATNAIGYEIQIASTLDFDDPLSVDVNATGTAVFRVDDDQVFSRARALLDPYTVSAFGDISGSDD
ncbi:FecR family protein [Granulosicoccus sp. 3-233]|uniref:FecR family protein n=1 Tax=Granulosicoccus sp. 3-233 TaxID=3417969 RepID=UPI003D3321D8